MWTQVRILALLASGGWGRSPRLRCCYVFSTPQQWRQGCGTYDVEFFLGNSVTIDERRRIEQEYGSPSQGAATGERRSFPRCANCAYPSPLRRSPGHICFRLIPVYPCQALHAMRIRRLEVTVRLARRFHTPGGAVSRLTYGKGMSSHCEL